MEGNYFSNDANVITQVKRARDGQTYDVMAKVQLHPVECGMVQNVTCFTNGTKRLQIVSDKTITIQTGNRHFVLIKFWSFPLVQAITKSTENVKKDKSQSKLCKVFVLETTLPNPYLPTKSSHLKEEWSLLTISFIRAFDQVTISRKFIWCCAVLLVVHHSVQWSSILYNQIQICKMIWNLINTLFWGYVNSLTWHEMYNYCFP